MVNCDLEKNGLYMKPIEGVENTEELKTIFKKQFDLVFVDSTYRLNLFSRVTRDAYWDFIYEAKKTLTFMDDNKSDGFEDIFMKKIHFQYKYDVYLSINSLGESPSTILLEDVNRSFVEVSKRNIKAILYRGYSDRITLIREYRSPNTDWKLSCPYPSEHVGAL